MAKPAILCVDDQREVLAALVRDLDELASHFHIIDCESADEATAVLNDLDAAGEPIALIVSDHVMPGQTGVDFLAKVRHDDRFSATRMLLLTGLATHDDTIRAINDARIDSYIGKPWQTDELLAGVKKLITRFVMDTQPDSYQGFLPVLDGEEVMDRLRQRGAPNVN